MKWPMLLLNSSPCLLPCLVSLYGAAAPNSTTAICYSFIIVQTAVDNRAEHIIALATACTRPCNATATTRCNLTIIDTTELRSKCRAASARPFCISYNMRRLELYETVCALVSGQN